MNAVPFRKANLLSEVEGDPIPRRATYSLALGKCGPVAVHCANLVMIATVGDDDAPRNVSIIVGQQACTCGCGEAGRALEYVPTPDQARMLAQQLIEAADAVDDHAKRNAAAFLDRVRKDRPR